MCAFLTVLYAGFAATVYAFSSSVLQEIEEDDSDQRIQQQQMYSGYIDNRFDVRPSGTTGFVGVQHSNHSELT